MAEMLKSPITTDEFLASPETNLRRELIDGEVIEDMTAPELGHQDSVLDTAILFRQKAQVLGGRVYVSPVDVEFDALNTPQPDVVYLAPNSRCQAVDGKRLLGPPDLIVEVLSPGTERADRQAKFRLYQRYGVCEYWLIDPRSRLIEVWQHDGNRFQRLGDVFGPGDQFESSMIGAVMVDAVFSS